MHVAFTHIYSQGSGNGGQPTLMAWEERTWMPVVVLTGKGGGNNRKPKGIAATPLKTNAYLHFRPQ